MKVFVYGTLKRGHYNSRLLGRSRFIAEGVGIGSLYISGKLPLLIEDDNGRVFGEIWEISKEDYEFVQYIEEGAGYYEGVIKVKAKDSSEFELCKVFYYYLDGFYTDVRYLEKIHDYTLDIAL